MMQSTDIAALLIAAFGLLCVAIYSVGRLARLWKRDRLRADKSASLHFVKEHGPWELRPLKPAPMRMTPREEKYSFKNKTLEDAERDRLAEPVDSRDGNQEPIISSTSREFLANGGFTLSETLKGLEEFRRMIQSINRREKSTEVCLEEVTKRNNTVVRIIDALKLIYDQDALDFIERTTRAYKNTKAAIPLTDQPDIPVEISLEFACEAGSIGAHDVEEFYDPNDPGDTHPPETEQG